MWLLHQKALVSQSKRGQYSRKQVALRCNANLFLQHEILFKLKVGDFNSRRRYLGGNKRQGRPYYGSLLHF